MEKQEKSAFSLIVQEMAHEENENVVNIRYQKALNK